MRALGLDHDEIKASRCNFHRGGTSRGSNETCL